jgi:two-component system sensor kinase FixL
VSLHQILVEAESLLLEKFRAQGVELDMALDAGADRILARSGQIKSAVLNLMVNALEAQPDGGHLEVHSHLTRRGTNHGPWIVLRFEDRGPGVPDGLREQIFEPFFTTKSSGSGIGLAVAQQNIRENGGSLALESPERPGGEGAAFVVFFPLAPVGAEAGTRTELRKDWARRPSHWRLRGRTGAGAETKPTDPEGIPNPNQEQVPGISSDLGADTTYLGGEVN